MRKGLSVYRIARTIHFCYGHRLRRYRGKCRHLHGHNGRLEVELASSRLNPLGMVMNFDAIKKQLQTWIDIEMDHKMILHKNDPLVPVLKKWGEPVYLMDNNPTAENIAQEIFRVARKKGLPVSRVTLWETDKSSATYQPA